jgi:hypothetical protein
MGQLALIATRARRADLCHAFVQAHGPIVQAGPFAGMRLPLETSWQDGDTLPKLVGCYEEELHEPLGAILRGGIDTVVNIGCAEGYYAVGLALRLPEATVHAFDLDESAQAICRLAAAENGVADRLRVEGGCTPAILQALLARGGRPLVLCDCEGAETELLDPGAVPALGAADLVVECHDFLDRGITRTLIDRLSPTHRLALVTEGARDPNASPFLRGLGSLDRWLAVCEYRPETMHWLVATRPA